MKIKRRPEIVLELTTLEASDLRRILENAYYNYTGYDETIVELSKKLSEVLDG